MPWKTIKEECRSIAKGISLLGKACQKWDWLIMLVIQILTILAVRKVGLSPLTEIMNLFNQGSP